MLPAPAQRWSSWVALSIIVLCGLLVRANGVWDYYFHTDELIHAFIANGHDVSEVFARGLRETLPPLGHFIRHLFSLVDNSIVTSRLLSVACGVAGILIAWRIGTRISPQTYLGLILAAMVALSHITVIYTTMGRNYCFLIVFLLATYYYFLCYAETRRRPHFYLYVAFSLAACATHFSAFIFTFALLCCLVFESLRRQDFRETVFLVLWHVPHLLVLAFLLYFFYVKTDVGYGWYNLYSTLGPFSLLRNSYLAIGLFTIYFNFFIPTVFFLILTFSAAMYGMVWLWRRHRLVCASVLVAFALQSVLSLLHLYPFVGNRYCLYLYPFAMLPLGMGLDALLRDIKRPATAHLLIALVTFATGAYAANHNLYFRNEVEFTNTNSSFYDGVEEIRKRVGTNDVVLTNKGSWLHLLYLKDRKNSGYFPEAFGGMDFEGRRLYFLEKRYFWEYVREKDFYEFLAMARSKVSEASGLWFLIIGTSDYSLLTLHECAGVKPHILSSYQGEGFLLFKLDKEFALAHLFASPALMESCYRDSKAPPLGRNF